MGLNESAKTRFTSLQLMVQRIISVRNKKTSSRLKYENLFLSFSSYHISSRIKFSWQIYFIKMLKD